MRVAVLGAGGLGSHYGALMAGAGADVTFIARGANLQAIRTRGLELRLQSGESIVVHPKATDDPKEVGPVDLLWFCVKNYDVEAAAEAGRPLVGPDTMIIPVQNGIDAPERLAAILGKHAALGGVARAGATLESPGVVVQKGKFRKIQFGELNGGITPRVERLAAEIEKAGIEAEPSADIWALLWEKFLTFCPQSAVCTLTRLPVGTVRQVPATRDLLLGIMKEVEAVARARGVSLPEGIPERAATGPNLPGGAFPSMYYDFLAGRRIEVEAIQGTVVRLGQELGVPTPYTFAVYALLKPYADGAPKPN